jgi:DNA adenine methylase
MPISHSPLRYPGGKQVLAGVLSRLIKLNGAEGGTYVEPYAGGAGAALSLLYSEHAGRILINDADPCIYAFWRAVLDQTDDFVEMLRTIPTTVDEWTRQRAVYRHRTDHSSLEVGFATFFLNRCNRSGIIARGGLIGGKQQTGAWKIDARFNRVELERRIRKVALYRDRILLSKLDGIRFLATRVEPLGAGDRPFVYLDPPYFAMGPDLYLNHYEAGDHAALATYLRERARFPWVLSYDAAEEIVRLYSGLRQVPFNLDYSAKVRRVGSEIMVLKPGLVFPKAWEPSIPKRLITLAECA